MEIRRSLFSQPTQCLQKNQWAQRRNQGHFLTFVLSLSLNSNSGGWGRACVNAHWDEGVWHKPSWSDTGRSSAVIVSLKRQFSPLLLGQNPGLGLAGQVLYPETNPSPSHPLPRSAPLLVFPAQHTYATFACVYVYTHKFMGFLCSFCPLPRVYSAAGISAEEDTCLWAQTFLCMLI